jgi:hypothetical protein
MTPEYANQLATELLLSGLASVLALSILATFLTMLFMRQRRAAAHGIHLKNGLTQPIRAYQPSVFENSCRWVAVRRTHLSKVQSALGLHNPIPCSWDEGVSRLEGQKLFISPSVRGWILVVGQGLPDPTEDVDRCYHFIVRLSRALGQVQFFSVNRALNHHAWVRAERGQIRRAYAWGGETLWNQGSVTQPETDLGLRCLEYGEQASSLDLSSASAPPPNTEKVLQLAARWSLDPSTVAESMLHMGLGVTGDLAHSRPH